MREFLRREWEDRRIPNEVRMRARDRAWQELHGTTGLSPGWLLAPSSVLILLLVWLAWPIEESGVPDELLNPPIAQLPLEAPLRARIADAMPPVQAAPVPRREIVNRPSQLSLDQPVMARPPRRLVLNFVLPRSGVRMIWIKEDTTSNTGEK